MDIIVENLPGDYCLEPHPDFIDGTDGKELDRDPGWHAKELILLVGSTIGLGRKTKKGEVDKPFDWNWQVRMGFAWEAYMARRLPTIWQPGELLYPTGLKGVSEDGRSLKTVAFNIDGYTHPEVRTPWGYSVPGMLEEFKYTSKSSGKEPQAFWDWHMQTKFYLGGLDQAYGWQGHRHCRIWVMFAHGDYKGEISSAQCWWCRYTDEEVTNAVGGVVGYLAGLKKLKEKHSGTKDK